jgi:hypothetical protein
MLNHQLTRVIELAIQHEIGQEGNTLARKRNFASTRKDSRATQELD